jgi:hypothetical protein
MGSGVWPLAMTTRPSKGQGVGIECSGSSVEKSVFKRGLPLRATGSRALRHGPTIAWSDRGWIKPIERLVPVGAGVAALTLPAYRRDGLSRLSSETWF